MLSFSPAMSARSFSRSFKASSPSSDPSMTDMGPLISALEYTQRSAVSNAARCGSIVSISSHSLAVMMWAAISWENPCRLIRRSNRYVITSVSV